MQMQSQTYQQRLWVFGFGLRSDDYGTGEIKNLIGKKKI